MLWFHIIAVPLSIFILLGGWSMAYAAAETKSGLNLAGNVLILVMMFGPFFYWSWLIFG